MAYNLLESLFYGEESVLIRFTTLTCLIISNLLAAISVWAAPATKAAPTLTLARYDTL